jgi:hypothetical protein
MRQPGAVLRWLERRGSRRNRDGMARYGIHAPKVRQIGKRNPALHAEATRVASMLAARGRSGSARRIGADALRELMSPAVRSRMDV